MAEEPAANADSVSPAPRRRARRKAAAPAPTESKAPAATETSDEVRAPRRATLSAERRRLLSLRRTLDRQRPIFGRQAANRYWRIGRDGAWRRPRGLQSKQRRHYGYRTQIVSVGYRSPAAVRGLVPSGFRPVLVRTQEDLERIDVRTEAAIIARVVGTRRRLTLEETARKLGVHVLNPIVKSEREG
jgi:large subunit ribosomal protein L32e